MGEGGTGDPELVALQRKEAGSFITRSIALHHLRAAGSVTRSRLRAWSGLTLTTSRFGILRGGSFALAPLAIVDVAGQHRGFVPFLVR